MTTDKKNKKTRPSISCSPVTLPAVVEGQTLRHRLVVEQDQLLLFLEIDVRPSELEILAIEHEGSPIVEHYEEHEGRLRACLVPARLPRGSVVYVEAKNCSRDVLGFRGVLCGVALASETPSILGGFLSSFLDELDEGAGGSPATDDELGRLIRDENGRSLDPPTLLSSLRRLCSVGVDAVEHVLEDWRRGRFDADSELANDSGSAQRA